MFDLTERLMAGRNVVANMVAMALTPYEHAPYALLSKAQELESSKRGA